MVPEMAKKEVIDRIEHLSGILIHVRNFDHKCISDLSAWFFSISRLAARSYQRETAAVSRAASLVLKDMVSGSNDSFYENMAYNDEQYLPDRRKDSEIVERGRIQRLLMNELEKMGYIENFTDEKYGKIGNNYLSNWSYSHFYESKVLETTDRR